MLLITGNHPQRRRQSRPRVLQRVHRSAAESLDGRRSGGYPATNAHPCIFNTFTHCNRRVYTEPPPKASFLP